MIKRQTGEMEKTIIKCAGCGKELAILYVKKQEEPFKRDIIIKCPFCGDKSLSVIIYDKPFLGVADGIVGNLDQIILELEDDVQKEVYEICLYK
jgi:DNA-directed RNA polymerase subunit RPC12/RpoP